MERCCQDPANREIVESRDQGTVRTERCRVCGRVHYVVELAPLVFGMTAPEP